MMRIVVCVKQIHHVYARTGMDPERNFLAPEDQVTLLNPYDEAALELALRVREAQGKGEIILLTLGALIAEKELRRCLAMGADRLCRIEADGRPDPWRKSGLLARAVKALGAHLILCGRESMDRRSGQVGAFMAHHLGVPFLSAITDLKIVRQDTAEVLRKAGRGGRDRIECPLPAVFSAELGSHEPRVPAYEKMKRAWSIPIQMLKVDGGGIKNKTAVSHFFPPRPRPKEVPAPESGLDAFDRIDQLLKGRLSEKKGETLAGTPEFQAEGILSFLKAQGFLKSRQR